MKKLIAVLFSLAALSAHADYVYNARDADKWVYVDTHTIILYKYSKPFALVKMPYCYIYSTSSLRVLTDDLGPYSGKILVDNEVCEPQSVTKLN